MNHSSNRLGAVSRPLLIALAVVLAAGAVVGVRKLMEAPTHPALDVGRGVVEEFLKKIRDGHAGEAWDATTAEFKSFEGRESFMRSSAKAPILKEELHFTSTQQVMMKDQDRTEYLYQSPESKTVRVLVGYDGGAWKVDRLTL
jgi:hypothetical protein